MIKDILPPKFWMNYFMQKEVPKELAEEYAKLRDIAPAETIENSDFSWMPVLLHVIVVLTLLLIVFYKKFKNKKKTV